MHEGFSKKYRTSKLVYYELFGDINAAISREKQMKGLSRAKKEAIIKAKNSSWADLYSKGHILKI